MNISIASSRRARMTISVFFSLCYFSCCIGSRPIRATFCLFRLVKRLLFLFLYLSSRYFSLFLSLSFFCSSLFLSVLFLFHSIHCSQCIRGDCCLFRCGQCLHVFSRPSVTLRLVVCRFVFGVT